MLQRIAERVPSPPPGEIWAGDDAAVLDAPGRLVLTTDLLVEHVDFDLDYTPARSIGWKAVAANVSDVSAMGATPRHAVASVALPPETELDLFDGLLDGVLEAGAAFGVALVGGDLSRAGELSISIALTGELATAPVLRSGARPGELVCVTGSLGGSAGGLRALRERGDAPTAATRRLMDRHLFPRPPVEAGPVLAGLGVTAMMDVSDGLGIDLARLLRASAAGCDLDPGAVPVDPDAVSVYPDDAFALAMAGGEDLELLFTVPESRLEDVRGAVDVPVAAIGRITEGDAMIGGEPLSVWEERGWDHLLDR
ncbi:MAG TPA: thiamine-phosphate kinase [Actinomycetota bacterium]|nr:thiamine-phosphate kinase [Actinomycetota bacterium]